MEDDQTLSAEAIRREVETLLVDYPDALVMAVDSAGLRVPMPTSVLLSRQRVLEGRSILDHVLTDDMALVAHAWYEALAAGRAETPVRLSNTPEHWLMLHFADLRAVHGVLLGIVLPETVEGVQVEVNDTETRRPRYASLHQTDNAHFLSCDEAFTQMFGWTAEDLAGKASLDLIHPDEQARAIEGWMSMIATRRPHQMRSRRLCKDGRWLWLDTTLHNYLGQPDRDYVLVEMIDISVEMAAQEALAAREQLLHRLAQAMPVGFFHVGVDRRVVYTNRLLHAILGTAATEDLGELLATVTSKDQPTLEAALTAVLGDGHDADIEVDLWLAETGEHRSCFVSARPLNGSGGTVTGAIVCVADVTETARLRMQLEDRATFDVLTRCHNRGATMATLEAALAEPGSSRTGVIFVDLDHFKPVNDLLGHAAGDELLVGVARRLAGAIRGEDILGRIGGDEFLVVRRHIEGPGDALAVAWRIAESVTEEITLAAGTIDLSASIGVACSEGAMSADALVARADEAMYHSKRQGKGLPVSYTPDLPGVLGEAARPRPARRVASSGVATTTSPAIPPLP